MNGFRERNQCCLVGVEVEKFEIFKEAERERRVGEMVDNESLA